MNSEPEKGSAGFNAAMLAVGIGAGTAFGAGMNKIGVGVAIGTAIGIGLAFIIPAKRKL
jgi:hypothetical protein